MSQLSAPIHYIVEHILPNYSDDALSGMLAARTNKDSLLYRAIIREMESVARTTDTGITTRIASHGDGPAVPIGGNPAGLEKEAKL